MASLNGQALVIRVSLGQTGDTVAVPSPGLLRPGARKRLIHHICQYPQTPFCLMRTPASCSRVLGLLPCWKLCSPHYVHTHAHTHTYTHLYTHLLRTLTTSYRVSRRGQPLRTTQLPPTSYSPSNVRADLGVSSDCSAAKGLGATAGVAAREDHGWHNNGQGQPQPQQDHAGRDPAALGHGSEAQSGASGGRTNAQIHG